MRKQAGKPVTDSPLLPSSLLIYLTFPEVEKSYALRSELSWTAKYRLGL
jgi:hypothetical protein